MKATSRYDHVFQSMHVVTAWLLAVVMLAVPASHAAPLQLSDGPLFLGVNADPNVFFIVDDSGSMDWEVMVGEQTYYLNYWQEAGVDNHNDGTWLAFADSGTCTGRRTFVYYFRNQDNAYNSCVYADLERSDQAELRDWRVRSSDFNLLYYNPSIDYQPWSGMPDASFTAARSNPQPGTAGYSLTRDLTGFRYDVVIDDKGYSGNLPAGPSSATDGANGRVDLFDSRVRHTVDDSGVTAEVFTTASAAEMENLGTSCTVQSASASVPYADCFGTTAQSSAVSGSDTDAYGRTAAETRQNIANWYQYHRKRSSVTRDAISQVVNVSPSSRFGLGLINDYEDLFIPVPDENVDGYGAHNEALLQEFRSHGWQALGTPLRRGLQRVGQYYEGLLDFPDPIISACQQNFSVLFTDGYWSGGDPSSAIGDSDGDGTALTLADVAHHYYERDLSPLPDQVPTSTADDADHQHMVTFGVAFGVQGLLEDTNDDWWPDPALTESDDWGNPFASDPEKIDDLWHAAYNSRGLFVSAQSPGEVAGSIREAMSVIADRIGSSASVASNSGVLSTESLLYQARFDSSDWSGQLLAFRINPDGSVVSEPVWNAGSVLNGQHYSLGRSILTFNRDIGESGAGIPFRWPEQYRSPDPDSEMSPGQVEALMRYAPHPVDATDATEVAENQAYGRALTDYLRGQRDNETDGFGFRQRTRVLGDIINSDPRFVGPPRFHYPDNIAPKPYSAFRERNDDRQSVVYVGANDGMLHGFNEDTGEEVLAYVPQPVFERLPELSQTDYSHRYYVDGGINIVDAYLPGVSDPASTGTGAWRSVLAGGLGKGGQGVFALDVTDPARFSEASAEQLVLWEFTDEDDADLGYTYGRPQIAKMANGRWAAVFGNGYNNTVTDGASSTTGHAALFIVDLETGELIRKISTGSGETDSPNGLATPVMVSETGGQTVDTIYAGDLRGQLWKFDVSAGNSGQWDVAHSQGNTPLPLFTTAAGQPITSQPQITNHPSGRDGFMLFFGTGKYLELGDNSPTGASTQSFYGIWDDGDSRVTDSDLLEQSILNQYVESFDRDGDEVEETDYTLREVSDRQIDFDTQKGWKIDLMPEQIQGVDNSSNFGEKVVSNALVRDGRVIFTTLLPSQQPCDFGGGSFVMQLDFRNGGKLPFPAFDLNGDGAFDSADGDASGRMSDIGIVPTPSVLSDVTQDFAVISGSSGDLDVIDLNIGITATGRQSWRQLE
ncbi:MAG: pilus assembly protein [Pseudomonadota bacterium]